MRFNFAYQIPLMVTHETFSFNKFEFPKGRPGMCEVPVPSENQGCHFIPLLYLLSFFCLVLVLFLSRPVQPPPPFPLGAPSPASYIHTQTKTESWCFLLLYHNEQFHYYYHYLRSDALLRFTLICMLLPLLC